MIELSEKSIAMRIHTNELGSVLAAADKELIGRTLKQGKIHFVVSPTFYNEELVSLKEFEEHLDEATNANLIGEKTVNAAQKKGLIELTNIIHIEGVPHAQVYKLI